MTAALSPYAAAAGELFWPLLLIAAVVCTTWKVIVRFAQARRFR